MCGVAEASLAIAALSSAAAIHQQNQAAKAQDDYNDRQREETLKAMNENMAQIELAKQQATTQAGQKMFENDQAARKAMATAKVSAGENGVAGLSVDALLAEMDGQRIRYNDSVAANLTDTIDSLNAQRTNVRNSAASQVNQLRTPQAPDYLGAALKIGSAGVTYAKDPTAKINTK